ncbi:MAG: M20 family metallopeptidase [Candidatus Omnitrophota bacterium]
MVNKERLVRLTQKLISICSENPPGDESRIARFVQSYLKRLKVRTRLYEFKKDRLNVVGYWGVRERKRSLLITPHLDTVPAGRSWTRSPFAGTIHRGRIYGLGATDCKGNLACALESIRSLVEEEVILDYRLIFAATADEESGSELGLIPLLERGILKADAALILDSDDFKIIVTQKGLLHLKVKVKGRRAHGAYPWRGINAIDVAIDIIKSIKAHKFQYKKNKFLKPPTVNTGTIRGGDKVNIVADWCEFELDVRFLPGMQAKDLLAIIKKIISRHAKGCTIEIEGLQAPYNIQQTHPLVASLKQAMRKIKVHPVIEGSEGATVITFLQGKNIPAVATGFGSRGTAHAADEYVSIDNLYRGTLVLEEFLKNF